MKQPQFTFEELETLHRILLEYTHDKIAQTAIDKIETAMMSV